jgi:type I site-specific restriction endonuclease
LAYAGGGSAGFCQRQTCEPGSHLGSRVRTRCIFRGFYQAIIGPKDRQKFNRKFSVTFFDLIFINECQRGSSVENSAWR